MQTPENWLSFGRFFANLVDAIQRRKSGCGAVTKLVTDACLVPKVEKRDKSIVEVDFQAAATECPNSRMTDKILQWLQTW